MSSDTSAAPSATYSKPADASFFARWTPLSVVFGCDLRTLALFRINLALLIIVDLGLRARDLTAHYTDQGILPRADYLEILHGSATSLHFIGGSTLVQGLLFAFSALVALALLVGYRTRLVTVLSWVMLLSLENRNHIILQGGDGLLLLLLFWGMFLPLGARFSVDRALGTGEPQTDNRFFSAGTVALLIQCMCVYFFTALLKNSPVYIPDGTAVYYALQLDAFATPIGHWLANFPLIMQGLTYYVWCLEITGPFLIFLPLFFLPFRLVTLFFLIVMHIGFFLCLKIGLFPFISITSLLTFLPAFVWDWLDARLDRGGREPIRVFYDGKCDFCRKICDLLRVFLILPGVATQPAQEDERANELMEAHNSWVVMDAQGNAHLRWAALVWLFQRSPIFWPVGAAIGRLGEAGDRVYGLVARNRWRFSGLTGRWLKYRTVANEPSLGSNLVVVFFLLLILRANLGTVGLYIPIPDEIRTIYPTLRLYQNWSMFAPYPRTSDTWLVPVATLNNGMVVDPREGTMKEPDFGKPPSARAFYPDYRWRKFTTSSLEDKNAAYRPLYAQYLCRKWNSVNAEEFQIESMQILVVEERTLPDYQQSPHARYLYWEGRCDTFQRRQQFDEAPEAL